MNKQRADKVYPTINITYTHTTVLRLFGFCPGQPGWAGTRRNIHPLALIVVINHPYLLPPSTIHGILSIHVLYSLFPQSLSKFSLVYLFAWHPTLHTPYISSPNHYLLFATHAHTIATCFAVVPRLCHLIPVFHYQGVVNLYTDQYNFLFWRTNTTKIHRWHMHCHILYSGKKSTRQSNSEGTLVWSFNPSLHSSQSCKVLD